MKMVTIDAGYGMIDAQVVNLQDVPNSAVYECTCTDYRKNYDLYWDYNNTAYAVECK